MARTSRFAAASFSRCRYACSSTSKMVASKDFKNVAHGSWHTQPLVCSSTSPTVATDRSAVKAAIWRAFQ